ncbi:MAG TPA: cupin domain-containing protein [Gemmatimonadales bacterium]|nr:cupin domain-containing protein [Gemmatimonadales bacterium]
MSTDDRLRPHPHDRLNEAIHRIDLAQAIRDLRNEPLTAVDGHRQITLVRDGPVSLILFAFEPGATLKEHRAPGVISIHVLSGRLQVAAGGTTHDLPAGTVLALGPGAPHGVHAVDRSDMLLTVART